MNTADIDIEFESPFNVKLAEMKDKLPPKLGNNSGFMNYRQVDTKEFCYKFLYCWLNNTDNQKNPNAIKVYNDIVESYSITDTRFPKLDIDNIKSIEQFDITFDVGFIINVELMKKGGSTPTQKRRPKRKQKPNHTIKDRVKTR